MKRGSRERRTQRRTMVTGYQVDVQIPGRPGRPGPLGDEEILEYCAGEVGELHVNLLLTRR